MKPDSRFANQDKSFWACVRSLSQDLGYTIRRQDRIKVPTIPEMRAGFIDLGLNPDAITDRNGRTTPLAKLLHTYYEYRAQVLNEHVRTKLMDVGEARSLFHKLKADYNPRCALPLNKQKADKKDFAFLTGIVNMTIERHSNGADCDYDPRKLTTVTRNGVPLRTLARRVDGAFPSSVNPIAIWEVKEYYYTTTFGSRVADGVYESLLDGLELEELRDHKGVDVKHYLFADAYNTWWNDGKAYLCRIIDMLNMGYADEVLFGKETIEELPRIVAEWVRLAGRNENRGEADPAAPA